jgi:hypothetical protein
MEPGRPAPGFGYPSCERTKLSRDPWNPFFGFQHSWASPFRAFFLAGGWTPLRGIPSTLALSTQDPSWPCLCASAVSPRQKSCLPFASQRISLGEELCSLGLPASQVFPLSELELELLPPLPSLPSLPQENLAVLLATDLRAFCL